MPIELKQDEFHIINLSRDLIDGDDYVSTIAVLTGCSSFSAIGIDENGDYIGLFGHAAGGYVDETALKNFSAIIESKTIRQLNILDVTLTRFAKQKSSESHMDDRVIKWANNLLKNDVIDGYKLCTRVSSLVDGIRYTQSGIVAIATCTPTAIEQLPDISKGNIDQIDHLNDIATIRPGPRTAAMPLLDHQQNHNTTKKNDCCIIL
ncbi:hypothetical protein L3V82_06705 [Thiotrichales bacterium 19S3-7]|nr:hypothetical protein [Thiotrichales bacterium 19S3-7]MCF6801788.1 hypothetical protein [Thiotrichales bacterium 19S3-11]